MYIKDNNGYEMNNLSIIHMNIECVIANNNVINFSGFDCIISL